MTTGDMTMLVTNAWFKVTIDVPSSNRIKSWMLRWLSLDTCWPVWTNPTYTHSRPKIRVEKIFQWKKIFPKNASLSLIYTSHIILAHYWNFIKKSKFLPDRIDFFATQFTTPEIDKHTSISVYKDVNLYRLSSEMLFDSHYHGNFRVGPTYIFFTWSKNCLQMQW